MTPAVDTSGHPATQLTLGGSGPRALHFKGVLRERDSAVWLLPLLRDVHRLAVTQQLDEVVLDLRELEYANAALFKCLVEWIRLIRSETTARYRVRVRAARQHRWQKLGMAAVQALGADVLTLEVSDRSSAGADAR